MPRQLLATSGERQRLLRESQLADEAQLQSLLRDNPELFPLEDLGLVGPAMVVGKETNVPSGAVDLVLVAQGGELILVEFKTGPKNPDFRAALAQVLDYGSDLWEMSLEDFERTVAKRFFMSDQSKTTPYHALVSLDDAITVTWPEMTEERRTALKSRLAADVASGTFVFVVAAQRLTDSMIRTATYLNAMHRRSSFALVEVVRFVRTDGEGPETEEVFEARTVVRPGSTPSSDGTHPRLTHDALMGAIGDPAYRTAVHQLLVAAEANRLTIFLGSTGCSIRLPSTTGPDASVAWFFPPGVNGWLNLKDLVLGYDTTSSSYEVLKDRIDRYMANVNDLGGDEVSRGGVRGRHFTSDEVCAQLSNFVALFDGLRPGDEG